MPRCRHQRLAATKSQSTDPPQGRVSQSRLQPPWRNSTAPPPPRVQGPPHWWCWPTKPVYRCREPYRTVYRSRLHTTSNAASPEPPEARNKRTDRPHHSGVQATHSTTAQQHHWYLSPATTSPWSPHPAITAAGPTEIWEQGWGQIICRMAVKKMHLLRYKKGEEGRGGTEWQTYMNLSEKVVERW